MSRHFDDDHWLYGLPTSIYVLGVLSMDRPDKLRGVQFISYADLARDIADWSLKLPEDIAVIAGIPRSGLTVAHMLAAELNIPAVQIHSQGFRQSTGRFITERQGWVLVVDDTASYGTTISEVRQSLGIPAYYGAVYARPAAHEVLDFWHRLHAEPDWLVVTQWNLFSHRDSKWILFEQEALRRAPYVPVAGVVSEHQSRKPLEWHYDQHPHAALLVTRTDEVARRVADRTGRATLSVEAWQPYCTGWQDSYHS